MGHRDRKNYIASSKDLTHNTVMPSVSFEQISAWSMRELWPLIKEHATVVCAILAGLVALVLLLALKRKLFRSSPGIADCQIRIDPCDLSPCRFFAGSIVAANSGRKFCTLLSVQLTHERLKFEFSDITAHRNKEFAAPERGTVGIRLPVLIKAKEKKTIFFFGYHRIASVEELPENLFLDVVFGRRKVSQRYNLARALETTYCLDLSGRDAGESS